MLKFGSILVLLVFVEKSFCEIPSCMNNCQLDEVYSQCRAGWCEPNCWNREGPQNCSCTAGCVCKPGTIRDPITFRCVSTLNCSTRRPGQCPTNEFWSSNLGGCQKTCDTRNVQFKCAPLPGCACVTGFIRSSINGYCVPESSCKYCPPGYSMCPKTGRCNFCCQECPENEEFNECGSYCEPNCKTLPGTDRLCINLCKTGCFCKQGFIRDVPSGKCIPKEWCQGEQFNMKGECLG